MQPLLSTKKIIIAIKPVIALETGQAAGLSGRAEKTGQQGVEGDEGQVSQNCKKGKRKIANGPRKSKMLFYHTAK